MSEIRFQCPAKTLRPTTTAAIHISRPRAFCGSLYVPAEARHHHRLIDNSLEIPYVVSRTALCSVPRSEMEHNQPIRHFIPAIVSTAPAIDLQRNERGPAVGLEHFGVCQLADIHGGRGYRRCLPHPQLGPVLKLSNISTLVSSIF